MIRVPLEIGLRVMSPNPVPVRLITYGFSTLLIRR